MLAKAQAAAAKAAQQAREAAERAAEKASALDTDTLMGNAVEGLESRLSGSFAKVSQLAEKSATSPMPSAGSASTPKKRALDNLQREVSTGRHEPRWPISRSRSRTLRWQELVALVRQERDANKKRKAELAALRRAVAAALLPSAAEGDEAVDIATLVQALEGLTSAGAGAGSGAGAAPEGGLHMVESSAAEAELLELQVPARLHDARGTAANALMHMHLHTCVLIAQRDMRLRPRSVGWRSKR